MSLERDVRGFELSSSFSVVDQAPKTPPPSFDPSSGAPRNFPGPPGLNGHRSNLMSTSISSLFRPNRWRTATALFAALALPCAAHPGHPDHSAQSSGSSATPAPGTESSVTITESDGYRAIVANGLPNHETGQFPGRGNPNAITSQDYHFRVPLEPVANPTPTPYDRQPFGVAINGVTFDPFTAGFWKDDRESGWREAANPVQRNLGLDENHAHVQPNGAYHYHGIPKPLLTDERKMTLLGWAADGFPIYGPLAPRDPEDPSSEIVALESRYRMKTGERPADSPGGDYDGTYDEDFEYVAESGDLDECNGRTAPTPEFPDGTYYYVITADYPYVPRFFRGTPDPSFERRGNRRPGAGPGPGRPSRSNSD